MADHLSVNSEVVEETFALWLISPLLGIIPNFFTEVYFLEIQLKPHHVAYEVREKWDSLLKKFTDAKDEEILFDEPLLVMKRNVQLNVECEKQVIFVFTSVNNKNKLQFQNEYENIAEILYICAKDEYMTGRYLVDIQTAVELAALQMAIEFEPYEMNAMPGENNEDVIENIR